MKLDDNNKTQTTTPTSETLEDYCEELSESDSEQIQGGLGIVLPLNQPIGLQDIDIKEEAGLESYIDLGKLPLNQPIGLQDIEVRHNPSSVF